MGLKLYLVSEKPGFNFIAYLDNYDILSKGFNLYVLKIILL